jgi:hypothetical protein
MYTNIPTDELLIIIDSTCKNDYIEENLKHDIIKLSKIIIDQNYFQFMDETYLQHEGLAMGAPTFSILSEFYLQHLENFKIYNLLINYNVMGYFRCADDVLIIYNESTTDIDDILKCFNNLTPKLKFTIGKEMGGRINFLDITFHREENNFSIDIEWTLESRTV